MGWTGAEPRERLDPTGRVRDLRLALVCLAGGGVMLAFGVYDRSETDWPLLIGPLVVVCAAHLLRRTAPVPALLIGVAAGVVDVVLGPFLGTILVFTELLYNVVLYGRSWVLPWTLRIGLATTLLTTLTAYVTGPADQAITVAVTLTLVLVMPVVTAIPVRQHRERARIEAERAEQVARLAELDRREALAAERRRMARELHDLVANHLSAVAIHATAALSLRDLDPATLRDILTVMRDNSVQGLAEMRQLVAVLREPGDPASGNGVRPRLADVGRLVDGAAGLDARLAERGEPRELPAAVDLAAYRIVQESLTNAGKHAPGGTAAVSIEYGPAGVVVTVDSTGAPGTPPPGLPGAGMGLVGMRERATLLGGRFTAGPHDAGWRVVAELPAEVGTRP